jgi:branched-chain amino acid transport system permease protein
MMNRKEQTKDAQTSKKSVSYAVESFCAKYKKIIWPVGAAVLLAVPFIGLNTYLLRILIMVGIYSMLAISLNLLTGYTGLVSLGHAGFFAIGAYVSTLLMLDFGINFVPAYLAGALVSALIGFLMGLPTMRLSGSYLTIVTLSFGEIVKMVLLNWTTVTNGPNGLKNIPAPTIFGVKLSLSNGGMYYLMLFLLVLVSALSIVLINSRTGRAFIAIKDDELAATMMGIKTSRFKIISFMFSAAIAGLAGGFYASLITYIDPNTFTFDVSTLIISIVILGGMGTMRGMYLGAAVLIAFPEVARGLMEWRYVFYGLVLVVMMRFRPQGLLGWKSQLPYKLPEITKKVLEERRQKKQAAAEKTPN